MIEIVVIISTVCVVLAVVLCASCSKSKVAADADDNYDNKEIKSRDGAVDNTDIPQDDIPDVLPQYSAVTDGNSPQLVNSFVANALERQGPSSTTNWYINASPVSFPSKETDKQKILFEAVKKENTSMVQDVIKAGVNLNVMTNDCGTCLHYAIKNHLDDIAKILLDNGASYEVNNYDRKSCIDYAIDYKNAEVLKYILEKFNLDTYYKDLIKKSECNEISSLV